jgi:hypothetical protein
MIVSSCLFSGIPVRDFPAFEVAAIRQQLLDERATIS